MNTKRLVNHGLVAAALIALPALSGSPAEAAADLEITAMSVQGTPRVGTCNTISMTVRNSGDAFTGNATLDVALITYPSGTPTQNRVQKDLFISPMQGGAQVTFNITQVEFKVAGSATVQGLVDSTQETSESNENNNSRTLATTVSGSCVTPPPSNPPPTQNGCDLSLTFTAPTGSTVSANSNTTYTVLAKNEGTGSCEATKLRLYRYNGGTASGYGSAVGGTRNIWAIPALRPGQTATNDFVDNPKAPGTLTYATKFLGAWNDANNHNHLPKKTVKAQ